MAEQYDVAVVGGGHNGLVAAAYLAKAGLRVIVLERRHIVGGASVTEEPFPGFKISTAAMVGGLLKPKIATDLELAKYGYRLVPYDPVGLHLFPDGRHMMSWKDPAKTFTEIEKFSRKDAQAYVEMLQLMERLARVMKPLELRPPLSFAELASKFGDPADVEAFHEVMFSSMKDFLDARFETEEVKATIAPNGTVGVAGGPMTPGTVYMMLHYWPETGPTLANVPGGMGTITQALARCAQSHGATIRTDAEVVRIVVRDEKAMGVELVNGQIIEAKVVVSNADPKRTYLGLVEPQHLGKSFRQRVDKIRTEGIVFKINLALSELPDFKAYPGTTLGPQHIAPFRICPTVEYLERAWDDAKYGRPSKEPYMYCVIHSATDPTVAPPGKHCMGLFIQFAPCHLKDTNWEVERDIFGKRCIEVLAEYAPNLPDSIIDYEFLSPKDLEERLYLTHGHMFHTESTVGQLLSFRPMPGLADYRTPIEGLYLCGAGTHPGDTVRGAPGHNAAHEIIRDWREGAIG